jgi:hypothetical protein
MILPPLTEPVGLTNIMKLGRPHRKQLLLGDTWAICMDNRIICNIPKNLLMAVSRVAQATIKANPTATGINIEAGKVAPAAIQHIAKWLTKVCHTPYPFRLPSRNVTSDTMAVLPAARVLGMEPYTSHIFNYWMAYLAEYIPPYEVITAIEANALTPHDAMFTHMANTLARLRYLKQIEDADVFEAYLMDHRMLRDKMVAIDARQAEGRQKVEERRIARHTKWVERQEVREKVTEARKASERALCQEEERMKEDLHDFLNGKMGASKVKTITAEQAAFLRRH